uniref:Cytochrome P450 n=1 Tax=Glossina pallidipes TaxID=7398 RepID=A0A1B0ACR9_GLOPL
MWIEFILLLLLIIYLFHRWATANNDFFLKRGIPYKKPKILFGNMWNVILKRKSIVDIIVDLYNEHDEPVYGIFDSRQPVLLIRDPDIIKQITVKNFEHFINHRSMFGDENDKNNLFGSSLVMMKDRRWKDMRSTLSPAFTGSKMRHMFRLMNEVAVRAVAYLKRQVMEDPSHTLEIDVKNFVTRYSNDIIASTAFGLEINSFVNNTNEFYLMGKKVTTFTFLQNLRFLLFTYLKELMKILNVGLFDKKSTEYFMRLVIDAMKYRKENNITRPDMINMLMEARGMISSDNPKSHNREWSDVDIVAQCFLFFFAGFDANASLAVYGFFDSRQPVLLIRDPDIIKQITVKDFNHFINHRALFNDENDQNNLFGSSLVTMRDSRWKDMRSTLSPAFTGSKMRHMFRLMNEVAIGAVAYLKQQQREDPTHAVEVDVTNFATRYSNDVIASTAFGLEVNSFVNNDNEFYLMGKKVTTPTFFGNLRFMLYIYLNGLMKFLRIGPFDKKSTEYFMRLVIDAMKYRKENNITRPDMINMLMEARGMISSDNPKPHNREWSDVDIVAQCFVFFVAGFAATASVTCFMAHEIMENAEVQEKLLQEIRETDNNLNGEPVTYEVIQSMRYMDNVISETLRKWTPATIMDRVCNEDITYELKNGEKLEIKKDDVIWIPTAGLHRDAAYYESPEKFDPERFNEANNNNINPFTYLPFGTGPRICIASRFALLETKVLIYYLLRDFEFAAAKKSCIPLKLAKSAFQVVPENGFWIKFIPRN